MSSYRAILGDKIWEIYHLISPFVTNFEYACKLAWLNYICDSVNLIFYVMRCDMVWQWCGDWWCFLSISHHQIFIKPYQNHTHVGTSVLLSKNGCTCISDFMQTTFFYLWRFVKKLADDQCSSILKAVSIISNICRYNLEPWEWIDLKLHV